MRFAGSRGRDRARGTAVTDAGVDQHVTDDGWEWAIVEVFGHRRHAGRTREEERFGAKMLRIDVPKIDDDGTTLGWTTIYYAGSSLFSFTPTDEATARRINKPYQRPALFQQPHDDEQQSETHRDDGDADF